MIKKRLLPVFLLLFGTLTSLAAQEMYVKIFPRANLIICNGFTITLVKQKGEVGMVLSLPEDMLYISDGDMDSFTAHATGRLPDIYDKLNFSQRPRQAENFKASLVKIAKKLSEKLAELRQIAKNRQLFERGQAVMIDYYITGDQEIKLFAFVKNYRNRAEGSDMGKNNRNLNSLLVDLARDLREINRMLNNNLSR